METSDGGRMMSVDVKTAEDSIAFTAPQPLFDSGYVNLSHATNFLTYDVSSDGQRFLIPRPAGSATGDATADTPITIVLNWQAGLKK